MGCYLAVGAPTFGTMSESPDRGQGNRSYEGDMMPW
jgi:hypothetical protein